MSQVIRTDFAHELQWERIQTAIVEPQTEDGFIADVEFVDDRAYDGLTPSGLLEIAADQADDTFAFLVDTLALTHPDNPILVVKVYDFVEGAGPDAEGRGPLYGATFRVVPSEMWAVQNNLSIANMDWEEFAGSVDDDGIFRGFS